MTQRVPRVLYHYCSLSTFKNILDNRSVWLSDIRKSNDSLELGWIMGKCHHYMLEAWVDYVKSVQAERGMEIVTLDHFKQFEELCNLARDYDAEDDTKNWVFCLSEKSDDLGQWRGYADDGRGIAIGFNSALLKNIKFIGDAIRSLSINLDFDRVHYSKKDIKDFFYLKAGLSNINVNTDPNEAIQYIKRALGYSYIFAPLYKSDKFKDEKEWRIFYSMHLDELEEGEIPGVPIEKNNFSDVLTLDKYAFAQRDLTLVSHLELGFPKMNRAINSVVIGPKANVSPSDIKLYLISIGLLKNFDDNSIKVLKSNISYK